MPTLCQFLDWDTQFFGVRIARANVNRLDPETTRALLAWCCEHAIDCLYFLADADHPATVRHAEANQFKLVDLRVTLQVDLPAPRLAANIAPDISLGPVAASEVAALRAIAAVSHHDSRFYADPGFAPARADALYETWIEQACRDDSKFVLVAHQHSQVAGYLVCDCDGAPTGRISLTAVAPGFQGHGIGGALVAAGLDWFKKQQLPAVQVVTQARNVRAMRLYEKHGFATQQLQLWYHRWFSPAQETG